MIKSSIYILRYFKAHTRRKGRLAFSSREAMSLIFLAGLPFVMASSLSINKTINHNIAYAYAAKQPETATHSFAESERLGRHVAARLKGNPDDLLKLKGAHVVLVFSTPGLQRAEGDMDVWQYRTRDCVMDLYIADNGQGDVMHYDMRPRVKAAEAGQNDAAEAMDLTGRRTCLKSVFNGHDGLKSLLFASR